MNPGPSYVPTRVAKQSAVAFQPSKGATDAVHHTTGNGPDQHVTVDQWRSEPEALTSLSLHAISSRPDLSAETTDRSQPGYKTCCYLRVTVLDLAVRRNDWYR